MTWVVAVAAFAGGFANAVVAEAFGWLPWLSARIIKRAARLLPAGERDRWREEWLAELEALPVSGISSLVFALRILVRAPAVARALTDTPEARYGFARQLLQVRRAELPGSTKDRGKRFSRGLFGGGDAGLLLAPAMCLLAFGAVTVYSASSTTQGDGYLVKFVSYGAVGLVLMGMLARDGVAKAHRVAAPMLALAFVLVTAVHIPHLGVAVNGARRWFGPASVRFEPSELMKLALVLYTATLLAQRPERVRALRELVRPLLVVVGAACLLLITQPDLGTAIVIVLSIAAMLFTAGMSPQKLALIGALLVGLVFVYALAEPHVRTRLTLFVDPSAHAYTSGYQALQGQSAIRAGGLFGVGPGQSVQSPPEAMTNSILALIGEDLGVVGLLVVLFLYGLIAYAGLRAAKAARSLYSALLAVGVTSLIVSQTVLNTFGVLGLVPLAGVPLPLVSYSASNITVTLAEIGLLLNVAMGETGHIRAVAPSWRRRAGHARGRPRGAHG